MPKSLQEQLMGSGLVDSKKAKAIKQAQRKKNKQQGKAGLAAEAQAKKERLDQERREKAEQDRALNAEKQQALRERELKAQVIQLINMNHLAIDGELAYQFVDGTKIKKIYVDAPMQEGLANGRLAIVGQDEKYSVVARAVAEKIRERSPESIISINEKDASLVDEDDPYKDYQIPDDLMW